MYKATVTGKRQITIPSAICLLLNINTGCQVEFTVEDNKVVFKKVVDKEEDICPICSKRVSPIGNLVNEEGQKFHLECWSSLKRLENNKVGD